MPAPKVGLGCLPDLTSVGHSLIAQWLELLVLVSRWSGV